MLRIRGEIANGRKAKSGDDRVRHNINVFINLSGVKSSIQMNMPVAGDDLTVDSVRELPLAARNRRCVAPRASHAQSARCAHRRVPTPRYSVPPMFPIIRCPNGISGVSWDNMRSPRSNPVMVLPLSFAIGA